MNFVAILVSALVPMAIGMVWYNPRVFGKIWMREAGLSEEKLKSGRGMVLIMSLSLLFSFLLSMILQASVIHQFGFWGMIGGDMSKASDTAKAFFVEYEHAFRTFKHGVLHGTMMGLFFILPIVAIDALFEGKSWAHIFIKVAYWTLTTAIMGGILCAWE